MYHSLSTRSKFSLRPTFKRCLLSAPHISTRSRSILSKYYTLFLPAVLFLQAKKEKKTSLHAFLCFRNSDWLSPHCPLSVQIVQAPEAMSVGDALRELDARQLITTDFILTFGDLVSNIKLDKALETHRARRKTQDKNSIMTMVLKEATYAHTSRPKDDSSVFVLDPNNHQCLFYEPVEALPRKSRIEISPEVFENHTEIEFRNDLVDPYLDICSVEVLDETIVD